MPANKHLKDSVRTLTSELAGLQKAGARCISDTLAQWLAAQYLVAATSAADSAAGQPIPLETLRSLSDGLVAIRRGDHRREHLQLLAAQIDINREFAGHSMEKRFAQWARRPANKPAVDRLFKKFGPSLKRGLTKPILREIEEKLNLL